MYEIEYNKISEMIDNLEALKKARELYWRDCPARQKYRFYTPPPKDRQKDRTYSLWLVSIQLSINKIKSDLDELFTCIILNGSGNWSVDGIKFALDIFANDLRKSGTLDAIIREFKEIRQKLKDKSHEEPAEKGQKAKTTVIATIVSLSIIFIFVLSVWHIPFAPFTRIKNHPHSYGIQGSIVCIIPCLILGFFKPNWRKWCWGSAALALLAGLLSLL